MSWCMYMCWCPGKFCKFSGNARRRNFLFFSQLFLSHVLWIKFWHVILHVFPRFFLRNVLWSMRHVPLYFLFCRIVLAPYVYFRQKMSWSCPENGHTTLACTVVACPSGCWFELYDLTERTCNVLHARTTLVCSGLAYQRNYCKRRPIHYIPVPFHVNCKHTARCS